jgi:putative transposase
MKLTMKKSRYTEEQIIGILKEHEAGLKTADVCREHGISAATFYGWKQKFGGMDVSEAQRLKALEDENRRLKLLVAELSLHGEALKSVIRKTAGACRSKRRCGVRLGGVPVERTHGLQAVGCGAVELSI